MKQLTLEQRYGIQSLMKAGFNQVSLAQSQSVHKCTINRKLLRNSQKRSYQALKVNERCEERSREAYKDKKLNTSMQHFIDTKSAHNWSLKQINDYCVSHKISMISIERIYQYVFQDQNQEDFLYQKHRS
jgi:IS30 family transposase